MNIHVKKIKILRLIFIGVLVLLVTRTGCKDDTLTVVPPQDEQPKGIIGSWNWLWSSGGLGGFWTPELAGYTVTEKFDPDSIWYLYRNDTILLLQSPFHVVRGLPSWGRQDTIDILKTYNDFTGRWESSKMEFPSEDTLVLDDGAFALDGGVATFARIEKK